MTTTETARYSLDQLTDDQCRLIWGVVRSEIELNRLKARLAHIDLPEGWRTDEQWEECPDTDRREIYGPLLDMVQPYMTQRSDGGFEDEFVLIAVPKEVAPRMGWELSRSEALDLARTLVGACDEIGRVVS